MTISSIEAYIYLTYHRILVFGKRRIAVSLYLYRRRELYQYNLDIVCFCFSKTEKTKAGTNGKFFN
jgi:hypothetical protein